MKLPEAVVQVLTQSSAPLTPQEIKEQIKHRFPEFYDTEAQRRSVEWGHVSNVDHGLLSQIYTLVGKDAAFARDKSVRPMRISLIPEEPGEETVVGEDFEKELGWVYVLSTGLFTQKGRGVVKIGLTTMPIEKRIEQLYTTGTPYKFQVIKTYKTKNFAELEDALHRLLAPHRLNNGREFFSDEVLEYIEPIVAIHQRIQGA